MKFIFEIWGSHIPENWNLKPYQFLEDVLGEDQFGFRRGKGTRDAIGMRILAERTLEIDEELCICFIDWQKAFDLVNCTKLMQIIKDKWYPLA
jgi:hypothetical protein